MHAHTHAHAQTHTHTKYISGKLNCTSDKTGLITSLMIKKKRKKKVDKIHKTHHHSRQANIFLIFFFYLLFISSGSISTYPWQESKYISAFWVRCIVRSLLGGLFMQKYERQVFRTKQYYQKNLVLGQSVIKMEISLKRFYRKPPTRWDGPRITSTETWKGKVSVKVILKLKQGWSLIRVTVASHCYSPGWLWLATVTHQGDCG